MRSKVAKRWLFSRQSVQKVIFFSLSMKLTGGLEQMLQRCCKHKSVFHHHAQHAEYSCVQSQEGAGKVAAGVETSRPHMETSVHSDPRLLRSQAFLSHLADSVLLCVHTVGVTFIWQEWSIPGKWLTQNNTHRCRMTARVHPFVAQADRRGWRLDHSR